MGVSELEETGIDTRMSDREGYGPKYLRLYLDPLLTTERSGVDVTVTSSLSYHPSPSVHGWRRTQGVTKPGTRRRSVRDGKR